MAQLELADAVGMSQFIGHNTDDCTQCAHLALMHTVDPARYPLTGAALDALVARDVANGWASPGGAQTAEGLAASLRADGVPFHQIFDASWVGVLDEWGGRKPIEIQVLQAGGVLTGDEAGVHGHAIGCVGWDAATGTGLFVDGDNRAAPGLVTYTRAQLVAARPFCVTVIDIEPAASSAPAGAASVSNTANLGLGFAAYVRAHPSVGAQVTPGEVYTGDARYPGESFAAFADGTILYYTQATGVRADRGPNLVLEFWQEIQALKAENAKLRSQLAAAAAPPPAPKPDLSAVQAALASLSAAVAALAK